MSRKVLIESLSDEVKEQITKDLEIKLEASTFVYNAQAKFLYPLDITDDYVYIPFAYGRTCLGGPFKCPPRTFFPITNVNFTGELRPLQKEITSEAIEHLNKFGSTIISAYCGVGKTFCSIYLSTKIKLKTLIIVHRIVLVKQWKESIKQFCPDASLQILDSKADKKECDFYIMNASNVPKRDKEFYSDIGTIIIDEAHLIMAEGLSKCMQMLVPRYVIGLSATPYREDGLNILLDLYFGTNKIHRQLNREHISYKLSTSFVPNVEMAQNGKVNWGSLLDSQALHTQRNEMIVRLVKFFPERVFLILCKRIEQGQYIVNRLQEEKEDVTSLIGKQQEYEQKSRILVGTTGKCSVGFDHPRLNSLILACDIQAYFIQVLGRIFRNQANTESIPMVIDIVDKNPILERHYKVRRAVYLEHGGKIKDFGKEFKEFKL